MSLAFPKPVKREPKPRKPLRRTWMRKKPPRRIARESAAEKYYKHWIHTQPCTCGCKRPVQQSHERDMTGMGLKEDNFRSIAMCYALHQDWTLGLGRFAGVSKEGRKAYFHLLVLEAHSRFVHQHGCRPEDWVGAAEIARKTR